MEYPACRCLKMNFNALTALLLSLMCVGLSGTEREKGVMNTVRTINLDDRCIHQLAFNIFFKNVLVYSYEDTTLIVWVKLQQFWKQ